MTIEIEDVSFAYELTPEHPVLREISCRIEAGEFVGVTGVSEAGKTSFLRLIAGHIPHFFRGEMTGAVEVRGKPTNQVGIGELAAEVGFVFENPYDQLTGAALTVRDEVAFGLENLGFPTEEIERRVQEALGTVGCTDLADRHPYRLSGGQTQRIAIASVLSVGPEILVLDEPTSQLDPLGTEEVTRVVGGVHEQGSTVVMSSHDLASLAPVVDRLIVLEQGRIRWDGSPRQVLGEALLSGFPIRVPDVTRIGHRLRAGGLVEANRPLPLDAPEAAAELQATGVPR